MIADIQMCTHCSFSVFRVEDFGLHKRNIALPPFDIYIDICIHKFNMWLVYVDFQIC